MINIWCTTVVLVLAATFVLGQAIKVDSMHASEFTLQPAIHYATWNPTIQNCSCVDFSGTSTGTVSYKQSCLNNTYGTLYEFSDADCTKSNGAFYSGGNGLAIILSNSTHLVLNCTNAPTCPIPTSGSHGQHSSPINFFLAPSFIIMLIFICL
jgi:hypothetical protein